MQVVGLLIVKNEEAVLQRCIDSWSKVCDSLFILDTGSSSKDYLNNLHSTKEIVVWDDGTENKPFNFSKARNNLIYLAEKYMGTVKTYFIMIDADDILPNDFQLPFLTKDVYAFNYRTSLTTSHVTYRMWDKDCKLRYVGAVHEYLDFSTRPHTSEILPLEIIHAPLPNKDKDPQRNLIILKSEMPTLRQLFYMGNELMDNGRFEEACIYWSHYIDRARFEPTWNQELMCCFWRLARYTLDYNKAIDICLEGLSKFPDCAELRAEVAYRNRQTFVPDIPWYEHLFGERRFYA
jgi:glycosyltransferase involved in cell wall biosynthesis